MNQRIFKKPLCDVAAGTQHAADVKERSSDSLLKVLEKRLRYRDVEMLLDQNSKNKARNTFPRMQIMGNTALHCIY